MNENSPICASPIATVNAVRTGMAEHRHDKKRRKRLGNDDDAERRQNHQRLLDEKRRIKQHADGCEKQHRKGIPQRQRVRRRLMTDRRLRHHHAGEESAQRHGCAEEEIGCRSDGHRENKNREREEFPRTQTGDADQHPGNDFRTRDEHDGRQHDEFHERHRQRPPERAG